MKIFLGWILLLNSVFAIAQEVPAIYKQLETNYEKSEFEACVKLTREVETFSVNRIDTLAANCFSYLGDAYNQLGKREKAIGYFEREKKIRQQIPDGDAAYYSTSIYNLAYLYLQSGQYAKAGAAAHELLLNDRKIYKEESQEFASSVLNIADIYIQLDRFKEAENLLLATIKHQNKNSVSHGLLLNKLGDLFNYTGQFSKASKALIESTDILYDAAGENSQEYTTAAINLGILYMNQGKYPEAEEVFDVSLSIVKPTENSYPALLNNQALVYQSLGQFERSEIIFEKIKRMDSISIGTSHPDYAITLSNLGQVLCDEEKYKEAEAVLVQALAILKKNNEINSVSYARKLNNLARVYQKSGYPEKAILFLEQSLAIFKKTVSENSPEYATTIFNLGNAYWKAGKGVIAIKHLKTSATIRAKVLGKKHPKYAESIQKIAEYQWEQKQINEARQSFGEVFDNYYFQIETTFPGLTEEEKSRFYYANIKDGFEKFNSFAVANATTAPQLIGDIYNYQINTKGSIMYATEKVKQAIISSNDTLLISLYEKWHSQKEQIARFYSQNQDHQKIDSLMQSANAIEKELNRKSIVFQKQNLRPKSTWQDIQKTLKPGEASVEVVRFKMYTPELSGKFTNDVVYAFLVLTSETKDQPQLIVMNNGKEMEVKFLKFYHNSIKYNLDDSYSYKNYFEPLADVLKKNNIKSFYFSPDGVYNQVNINTIQNPFTQQYLLDEYDITLLTNTKELLALDDEKLTARAPVLIGFPKFNLSKNSDSTLVNEEKTTRGGSKTRGQNLTRGMRGLLRFMRGEDGITELPGTEKEIQEISKLFTTAPEIFLASEATEDAAKKVNNPAYLHIATHGYFLEDEEAALKMNTQYVANPLLKAGLILAGAENFLVDGNPVNAAGDDGILTAYEAMNLKLDNTNLVVLSACETGLGEVKNGEGVYGLQRAFKLAGAQNIVMSLWSVDDAATQELMSSFYQELLKTGNQHQSFRTAQQTIKAKYKKPFFWGAFIMVGN